MQDLSTAGGQTAGTSLALAIIRRHGTMERAARQGFLQAAGTDVINMEYLPRFI